ncbi:MAG: hypothetical protein ABJN69_01300 [Hellea sp.]
MAELFNAEQYHQQMSGQNAQMPQGQYQGQPQDQYQAQQPIAQPYQPQQMQQTQTPPNPYQPQEWAPQHQPMQQTPMMQPQTPMHHMPAAPVFAPPPGMGADIIQEAPKPSRFKRGRLAKVKTPKVKKTKAKKSKGEAVEASHTTKTSPAIIFMFGMATGIVCFVVGNMAMSNLLTDNSAKSFRDIERQNATAQQPVLPKSAQNTEG